MLKMNKDVLFAVLRIGSLGGVLLWIRLRPNNYELNAIYSLLAVFAIYSLVLYLIVLARPGWDRTLYRFFLVPDLLFLSLMSKYTGSTLSEFENSFYLIVALHTFYYQSMRAGLMTATLATITYTLVNLNGLPLVHWSDLLLRMILLFLVALCVGFLTWEIKDAYNKLSHSNQSLNIKLDQITSLYEVNQGLAGAETQIQVHELAVAAASTLLQAPVVFLLRPEGRKLRFVKLQGLDPEDAERIEFSTSHGIVGKAFKGGEPLIIPDVGEYERFPDLLGMEVKSLAMAPLLAENRVLGILCAGRPQIGSLNTMDSEFLGLLASMTGTAILRTEGLESTRRQAITDPKTELYNYRYFKALLEEYIVNKPCENLSLLMLDIDHFKKVNDTWGHPIGDEVLKMVAATFASVVRSVDVVARYGGEEFVAILPDCPVEEAFQVGERVRIRIEDSSLEVDSGIIRVTVSLGATSYRTGETLEDLVNRVDQALYKAKGSGRNQVCVA